MKKFVGVFFFGLSTSSLDILDECRSAVCIILRFFNANLLRVVESTP